jgi:gluconolactonase
MAQSDAKPQPLPSHGLVGGTAATPARSLADCRQVADGLDHPECVAFDQGGALYAGGEAGQIYRRPADGQPIAEYANTGGSVGGFALDAADNLYECNYGNLRVNKVTPEGEVSVYSSGTAAAPARYPNYPAFDTYGNLFYSDSGGYYDTDGRLYVVRPDGETALLISDGLAFPNGLALSSGGEHLYIVLSGSSCIARVRLLDRGRACGEPELYATLPGTVPDGIAFSEAGNLYVACYVPDAIYVIEPNRNVELLVADTRADVLNRPTNVAFAPGGSDLYFANLGGSHVGALPVDERGLPLPYPEVS